MLMQPAWLNWPQGEPQTQVLTQTPVLQASKHKKCVNQYKHLCTCAFLHVCLSVVDNSIHFNGNQHKRPARHRDFPDVCCGIDVAEHTSCQCHEGGVAKQSACEFTRDIMTDSGEVHPLGVWLQAAVGSKHRRAAGSKAACGFLGGTPAWCRCCLHDTRGSWPHV